MSQLQKAKQRLLLRSSSIMQTPQQDPQFKPFVRTGNASSIPKLNIHKKNQQKSPFEVQHKERSNTQQDANDQREYYQRQYHEENGNTSPGFSKTQRPGMFRAQRFDAMSEYIPKINIIDAKGKSRRITQYSRASSNVGPNDISFTEIDRSVYNQSPEKVVKNTVHNDKMSLIIAKPPLRRALSPFKPRQCILQIVESQFKQQKSENITFTDGMFPPRFTTIFNKKYMYLEQGLKLERLSKIYAQSQARLIKYCEPTLIVPGKFTSPALYSALIILSEEPTRVLNIIGNQQYNQNGMYYVHICKDGVWRYIVVDDYLPVKILGKRSLLFTHTLPRNNFIQFWPAIIEKSLAKVFGTYQDIFLTSSLGIRDLFRNLTGYPVSQYPINKDFRTYLVVIDAAIKKKQIVVLEQIPQQYHQTAHLKGLEPNFSYQIIQVKKTYVVVRNLNDKELVTKLTFQEVLIFCRLMIFRAESGYVYVSRTLRHKKGCYSVVKLKLQSPIKCYWDIWQNSQLYYKNHIGSHISYKRSPYKIQIEQQRSASPTSNYDSQPQEQIITESGRQIGLGIGTYYLKIHLCQEREQDFVLSYYGDSDVNIQRVKNMGKWENSCFCL